MRIKDLPEPVKTFALNNQEKQSYPRDPEKDVNDFYWADTPEGTDFWIDVYDDIFSFNSLAKKYDTLDWGFQVEGNIQTDNSKVNENLLKENEELKLKLKSIEEWALERYDSSEDLDEFDNGISNSAVTVLAILGINTQKAKAMEVFKDLSEEAKKELRKLLNQD